MCRSVCFPSIHTHRHIDRHLLHQICTTDWASHLIMSSLCYLKRASEVPQKMEEWYKKIFLKRGGGGRPLLHTNTLKIVLGDRSNSAIAASLILFIILFIWFIIHSFVSVEGVLRTVAVPCHQPWMWWSNWMKQMANSVRHTITWWSNWTGGGGR